MFYISFRQYCDKTGKQLVYFDHQNINSLYTHHHYVNSMCIKIILLSHKTIIFNQSAHTKLFSVD